MRSAVVVRELVRTVRRSRTSPEKGTGRETAEGTGGITRNSWPIEA